MPDTKASKHIASTAGEPLNTAAAARFIGTSASWLEKSRVRGDGPRFRKIGARVVYDRAELETWCASKGRASTAEYEPLPRRSPRAKPAEPKAKASVTEESSNGLYLASAIEQYATARQIFDNLPGGSFIAGTRSAGDQAAIWASVWASREKCQSSLQS